VPWAKQTYERTVKVYKDVLEDTLMNHQKDIDLLVKELLIRGEILKHDFTKRQLTILSFIITFSFNYGKEWAYIPKLSDFSVAGISIKHIRSELNKLIEMNIITENKEESLYSVNEPRYWRNAPYNYGYNDQRSQELFLLNLDHAGIDVSPIIQKLKNIESILFLTSSIPILGTMF
jgi:hypothetical protein